MTNELEKQFFDTFEIEPKEYTQCTSMGCRDMCGDCNNCQFHNIYKINYPQITERILLGLICILTKRYDYADQNWLTKCNDVEELKVSVLRLLLLCTSSIIEKYKDQVRTLFEEG